MCVPRMASLVYTLEFVINFLSRSVSLASSILLMMSHSLTRLSPAHHSHPPSHTHYFIQGSKLAPCGLRGCKNGPAPFPGRMTYKATKPGLVSVLYLSKFLLCWCLLGPLFMYC